MITLRDTVCAGLGSWYIHPVPSEGIVDAIRKKESTDVAHIIEVLAGTAKKSSPHCPRSCGDL